MIKLGLIGKNISHSKSPEIYKKFLGDDVVYTLLDFKNPKDIPAAETLFNEFDGINVTSPYKKHFVNEIELVDDASFLRAINCLRKSNGKIEGVNTDYLAIEIYLNNLFSIHGKLDVIILGDGVMSSVVQYALDKYKRPYKIFSRKLIVEFSKINLLDNVGMDNLLVINTCSREFIYSGELNSQVIFWDFNYNFPHHSSNFDKKCTYIDGINLLTLQAEFALQFWSINKKI